MTSKTILFFVIFSFSLENLRAAEEVQKNFYILGGGGEPEASSTIFDYNLTNLASFSKKANWKTTISFNGGHKKTEEIIKKEFEDGRNLGSFDKENYNTALEEMIAKIKSGEIKYGSQLMVSIDSHGAERKPEEKTHSIAVANSVVKDFNSLNGTQVVNLDKLQDLINIAEENQVKLAILDMSCFSGNLLNLKGNNVCMISSTGPQQYSYLGEVNLFLTKFSQTFSGKLFENLKKGKNLEEVFLKARKNIFANDADYPMISTPEGREIDNVLYPLLKHYLNYNSYFSNLFSRSYDKKNQDNFEYQVCHIENQYTTIIDMLKFNRPLLDVVDRSFEYTFSSLISALEKYRDYQKMYEKGVRMKLELDSDLREILKSRYQADQLLWKSTEPTAFLDVNYDHQISYYENQHKLQKDESSYKKLLEDVVSEYKRKRIIANEIKAGLSKDTKLKFQEIDKLIYSTKQTRDLASKVASKVASKAKLVYEELYKKNLKVKTNPCREFVL